MTVEEMLNALEGMPRHLPVVMADLMPVVRVVLADYGNGCVIVTDEEEKDDEETFAVN